LSNTVQYRCPNCGGDIAFSPSKQGYECEYCQSFFTQQQIEEAYADIENQDLSQAEQEDSAESADGANLYICNSCGAEIVADAQTTATFCCYCHNPVTLKGRLSGEFKPNRVMPFNIDKSKAEKIFKDWCGSKWFTPSDFNSNKTLEKMTGLYVPYWLADCKTDAHIEGTGKKIATWHDSKFEYTKTDEYRFVRDAKIDFNGIPIDGEKRIDDKLMEAIEPFDYSKLKPFSMSYLTGFYADKYDLTKAEAMPSVKKRALDSTLQIVKEDTQYDVLNPKVQNLNVLKTDWEYTLMPVWFLNYKYQDKFYTFVVNGQSGKVAGILPLSKGKLFGFGVGLTVVLTIILSIIGGFLI
jgi:DNA-directed RNA polymerase subunit RPC12/RpoP